MYCVRAEERGERRRGRPGGRREQGERRKGEELEAMCVLMLCSRLK